VERRARLPSHNAGCDVEHRGVEGSEEVKFVLHPGFVRSKNDGQHHFIGVAELARLYELHRTDYTICYGCSHELSGQCRPEKGRINLGPLYSGNYLEHKDALLRAVKAFQP
jgi:hypothetical protein